MSEATEQRAGLFDRLRRGAGTRLAMAARVCADFVVPPVCLGCQRALGSHDALCASCWRQISFIRPPLCDRLGIPLPFDPGGVSISAAAAARPPDYDRARAVASYDGVMSKLIHGFKYSDRHDLRHLFGKWLVDAGSDLLADADLVVPVPLYRSRLLARRFNQSAILANEIARHTRLHYAPQALIRVKRTRPQVGLTTEERRRNVRAAFVVPQHTFGPLVEGKRVVLIDDVVTTGATVEACARVLRRGGAAQIDVLALALVVQPATVTT